jgi:hypothetical protein
MGRVNTVRHCGQNMYIVHIQAVNINSLFYKHPSSIPHFPLKELTSGRWKGVEVVFVTVRKNRNAEERGNTKKKGIKGKCR